MPKNNWQFETLAVHYGNRPQDWMGASQVPIYMSAAHRYETPEELSGVFAGTRPGYIYQRMHNPTSRILEETDRAAGRRGKGPGVRQRHVRDHLLGPGAGARGIGNYRGEFAVYDHIRLFRKISAPLRRNRKAGGHGQPG